MNTTKTNFKLLLACLSLFLFSACSRQEGCTDPAAVNFDPFALVSDGSCYYLPGNDPFESGEPEEQDNGGNNNSSYEPVGLIITHIELQNISLCDGNGTYWDGSQWDKPDIQISLYQSGTNTQYNSPTAHNVYSYVFNNVHLNVLNLYQPLTIQIQELDFVDGLTIYPISTMLTYNFQVATWTTNQSSITMTVVGTAGLCNGNTADMSITLYFSWIY